MTDDKIDLDRRPRPPTRGGDEVNPDRIKFHVPAGHPLDGTTYRMWPESGATTYWTDVSFTSSERLAVERELADLRSTLARMQESVGPHFQVVGGCWPAFGRW